METYTVAFFGHRELSHFREAEIRTEETVRALMHEKKYVEFLVGRNGVYDQIVSSTIRRVQKALGKENSAHVLVLPNETAEFRNNRDSFLSYYDEVRIPEEMTDVYFRRAITERNRYMVDAADLVLCCIERKNGGAWTAAQYAIRSGKEVRNLLSCVSGIQFGGEPVL